MTKPGMESVRIILALAFAAPLILRAEPVVVGNARFMPLTDRMVRCEWSEDGVFEDRPSLTFAKRDLSCVDFKSERRGKGVFIKTPRLTLEWTGGAFNETNLFVNGVAVLSEDTENLLGTQRGAA